MQIDPAVDRFLASPRLAASTRRSYGFDLRDFAAWLERRGTGLDAVDVRVLADYVTELGRRRPKLAPASIARRISTIRSFLRFTLGAARVPETPFAPAHGRSGFPRRRSRPRSTRCSTSFAGDGPLAPAQPGPARARLLRGAAERRGGRARPRATSTSSRSSCSSAARAARSGSCRSARRRAPPRALPARRAAGPRTRRERRAVPLRARPAPRHELGPPAAPAPAPAAALVRDPPARGRRRPADDPGAARPLLALDDADLQPRRRQATAKGL